VYVPILNINYFHHFLDIPENYNPIDDEPMWAADRVVALTPGFAITIPETANELAIKGLLTSTLLDLLDLSPVTLNLTQKVDHPNLINHRKLEMSSDDEDEEPTPQPKPKDPKPVKENLTPKPYKPKIPYPQRLKKEKIEAQHGKFLNMILAIRINVPLVDVLAGMPNYGKFLKELVSNKHKLEQISVAFLCDDSYALIQNKVPPKHGDPGSFLIPCNFNKAFSCDALADLGSSINLMPYSLYAKLSLETLKPTKMSVRLADRSFQYPVEIAKNILVEVGKFTFPVDFVILEIINVIDEILEEDFDALLGEEDTESESDIEELPFEKITFNTDYKIKTSLKEPPMDLKLKPIPDNLEYAFLEEPSFLPVIISSQLFEEKKTNSFPSLSTTSKPLLGKPQTFLESVFDIEIKDKKGTENVAADHLSRIENDETIDDSDIDDNFIGETLMEITTNDTPWFAEFANYLVGDVKPKGMTNQQKKKFFSDLKNYF
ncbi:reverse transcriptase domain-containing protein, partial [Tanacetum coccineum]